MYVCMVPGQHRGPCILGKSSITDLHPQLLVLRQDLMTEPQISDILASCLLNVIIGVHSYALKLYFI